MVSVNNKKAISRFILLIVAIPFAAYFFPPITAKIKAVYSTFSNSARTRHPEQPSKPASITSRSNSFNQVLRQRYLAATEQQAFTKQSANDPDSLQMVEEALHSLHNDQEAEDRELAVMTLGEYATDNAKEGILFALGDPDMNVREQAVIQISEWGDAKERQRLLIAALENNNSDIVVLTLESISEVDDPQLIERLSSLSKDKNEQIREAAELALALAGE